MLLGKTLHLGQPAKLALNFRRQHFAADAQAGEKRRHHPIGLRYQRSKQMHWLNLLVFVARGNFLRALDGLLGLDGHFFKSQHTALVLCRDPRKKGWRFGQPLIYRSTETVGQN